MLAQTEVENNKRIAKNTLFLYLRMILVIGISLYTSRVILRVLGVSDYGVYNVVGGIIGMLGYINTLLAGGTSRFLTISLGRGDKNEIRRIFSLSNLLCFLSAAIFLLFGETLGLWFVNTHLNIDPARINAAIWVYQFSLISATLTVFQLPYSSSIIAHEKMNVYAYMSILEVIMKLIIVYALLAFDIDKLKLYGALMCSVSAVNLLVYALYCHAKFEETTLRFYFEKKKFKEMFSYSGWNMVGAFANVLNNYGLNVLLNIFFGTVVNAARGLAVQVNNVATQLYSNFQTASQPQIVKYYAQGDIDGMSRLINNTSKYSGYLLLCLIIPVIFNANELLQIWLGHYPEYTAVFVRLILLQTLCAAIDFPVGMGIHAVGRMKLPNLTVALIYIAIFPITYISMRLGAGPTISYLIYIAISPIILYVDLLILKKYTGFSIVIFLREVIAPILVITILGAVIAALLKIWIPQVQFWIVLLRCAIIVFSLCVFIYFFGLSNNARRMITKEINNRFFYRH